MFNINLAPTIPGGLINASLAGTRASYLDDMALKAAQLSQQDLASRRSAALTAAQQRLSEQGMWLDENYRRTQLAQQAAQYASDYGLKANQLSFDQSSAARDFDLRQRAQDLQDTQFNADLGYRYANLNQSGNQFNADLGYRYSALDQQNRLGELNAGITMQELALRAAQAGQSTAQWNASFNADQAWRGTQTQQAADRLKYDYAALDATNAYRSDQLANSSVARWANPHNPIPTFGGDLNYTAGMPGFTGLPDLGAYGDFPFDVLRDYNTLKDAPNYSQKQYDDYLAAVRVASGVAFNPVTQRFEANPISQAMGQSAMDAFSRTYPNSGFSTNLNLSPVTGVNTNAFNLSGTGWTLRPRQ